MDREARSVGDVFAALLGGVTGAIASGLLVRMGIRPRDAAIGVALTGGVGAVALRGPAQRWSAGIAATGVGQLALTWMHREEEHEAVRIEVRRQGVAGRWAWASEFDRAMERARDEVAMHDAAEAMRGEPRNAKAAAVPDPGISPEMLEKVFALFRPAGERADDGARDGGGDAQ